MDVKSQNYIKNIVFLISGIKMFLENKTNDKFLISCKTEREILLCVQIAVVQRSRVALPAALLHVQWRTLPHSPQVWRSRHHRMDHGCSFPSTRYHNTM